MSVELPKRSLANGRYKIIAQVGIGGMATVYRAYDSRNDRDVAIKILLFDLAGEASFLRRFQRESEMMHDLDHPNILRAYEFGQDGDAVYLVMSWYGGGTLKERIVKGRGLASLTQTAEYLDQIAAGLGYAHARGIVHRDMKPSNILIHHAEDHLVISDFGIAKALGPLAASRTGTGNIMGTPRYMAPEQFLDRVDRRSDIYALGIILYEMLTGRVPFTGEGLGFKHMRDTPPTLAEATTGRTFDPAIEAVVAKALAKQPDDRYQTAEEMAQAFRAAVRHQLAADPASDAAPLPALPFEPRSGSFAGLALPAARLRDIKIAPPHNELATRPPTSTQPTAPNPPPTYNQRGYGFIAEEPLPPPVTRAPRRRKRDERWWLVILPLIIVMLVAGGVWFFTQQTPTEAGVVTPTVGLLTAPASRTNTPQGISPTANISPTTPLFASSPLPTPAAAERHILVAFVTNPRTASNTLTGISVYDIAAAKVSNIINVTTTGPVTTSANPTWASDGQSFFYHYHVGTGGTFHVLNSASGTLPALGDTPAVYPALSQQDNKLAFVVPQGQPNANAIYTGDAANGPYSQLVGLSDSETIGPAWSPDATRLAFTRTVGGIFQIFVVSAGGGTPQQITHETDPNTRQARFPAWSPDGKKIIFSFSSNAPDFLPNGIFVINADGTGGSTNLAAPGHAGRPFWACDVNGSSRIYFGSDYNNGEKPGSDPQDRSQIFSIRPDGSDLRPLLAKDDGANDYNPAVYVKGGCPAVSS